MAEIEITEQIDSTSDFETQTQVKEREIKIPIKKPQFKAPWIDFGYLWKEFKNFNSNHQESTKNLNTLDSPLNDKLNQIKKTTKIENVKKIVKSNWLKASVISFLLFVSSTYDVVSDGLLSYSFLNGTYYTKILEKTPDSQFWTIKYGILVNKAQWDPGSTKEWKFSRDYSWADNPDFENSTYTLSLKKKCEVTCFKDFCQVRAAWLQGTCFLPPSPAKCSVPVGCGSCVNECSNSSGSSSQGMV